jgi:hypothetical protein
MASFINAFILSQFGGFPGQRLMGSVTRPIHFIKDFAEIRKTVFFLAQESRQQEMGEFDRVLLSVRDNEDDINLREQSAKPLHPLKLFPV